MPAIEIDLRGDDDAEVSLLSGMDVEGLQIGDVLLWVSDRISEAMAKELAFQWLSVKGLRENITPEQFWQWLGQAANEKVQRDTDNFKLVDADDNKETPSPAE